MQFDLHTRLLIAALFVSTKDWKQCVYQSGEDKSQYILTVESYAMLSHFSDTTQCDPRDGSPPGSPVPGILQARTLESVAISFSNAWKWKVKVKSLSHVRLLATPGTAAYQAPPSMGFSRQEYWSGVPLPSPSRILCSCQKDTAAWAILWQGILWKIHMGKVTPGMD